MRRKWWLSAVLAVAVGILMCGNDLGKQHDDSPIGPTPGGKIVITHCANGSERSDCK
jgi:hypothetical protein